MKIFLLVVTVLFLINRIKTTPQQLSEKLYKKNLNKSYDDLMSQKITGVSEEDMKTLMQGAFNIILFFATLFHVVYYSLIAGRFPDNTIILVLSVAQIVTCIITYRMNSGIQLANIDEKYNKFHRWYFLFNIIVDYAYYPFVIYMLLTN